MLFSLAAFKIFFICLSSFTMFRYIHFTMNVYLSDSKLRFEVSKWTFCIKSVEFFVITSSNNLCLFLFSLLRETPWHIYIDVFQNLFIFLHSFSQNFYFIFFLHFLFIDIIYFINYCHYSFLKILVVCFSLFEQVSFSCLNRCITVVLKSLLSLPLWSLQKQFWLSALFPLWSHLFLFLCMSLNLLLKTLIWK